MATLVLQSKSMQVKSFVSSVLEKNEGIAFSTIMHKSESHHLVDNFLGCVSVGVEFKLDRELVHALEDDLER